VVECFVGDKAFLTSSGAFEIFVKLGFHNSL
jgi:hypothetical protein